MGISTTSQDFCFSIADEVDARHEWDSVDLRLTCSPPTHTRAHSLIPMHLLLALLIISQAFNHYCHIRRCAACHKLSKKKNEVE